MNKYALFIKLIHRNCPVVLINLLDCWYLKIFTCVKWGSCFSSFVELKTGTRQGGIISPTLFSVFIDDVLIKLQKSGLGGHIHNLSLNAFMYADDLLLLSISLSDLQSMIDICKSEFDWLDMSVNASKSMSIRVGKRFDARVGNITIGSNSINWCKELQYLGVVIVSGKSFNYDLHNTKLKYFRALNGLLGKMGSSPNIQLTLSLINSFCTPVLCYGIEAMLLTKMQLSIV